MVRFGLSLIAALIVCARCCSAGELIDVAGDLPADLDLLIAVDNAAALRAGPCGKGATAIVASLTAMDRTADSWARLAALLGWSETEAFDRLLGRRAVLVGQWGDRLGAVDWVLISDLDPQAQVRLNKSLRPAPRKLKGGLVINAVEQGDFFLSWLPRQSGGRMLLAPSGSERLLDQVATGLLRGLPQSFEDTQDFRSAIKAFGPTKALRTQGLVFYRYPLMQHAWSAWLIEATDVQDRTIRAMRVVDSGRRHGPPLQIEPWSRAAFDDLAPDSALVIMEAIHPDTRHRHPALELSAQGLWRWLRPQVPEAALGHRMALVARRTEAGAGGVAIAVEARDLDALAAPADARMAALVRDVTTEPAPGADFDFKGNFQEATRRVNCNDLAQLAEVAEIELAWRFDDGGVNDAWSRGGWWTVGIGSETVQAVSRRLTAPEVSDDPLPRAALGLVRPSQVLDILRGWNVAIPPQLEALRWIEETRWDGYLVSGDLVVGNVSVTFAEGIPAPDRRPVDPPAIGQGAR